MNALDTDECATEADVMRMLEWWEHGEDGRFGGTEELRNITLAELKALFEIDEAEDPCMFYQYIVSEHQVPALRHTVSHFMDPKAYTYFVAAYQRPKDDS